MKLDLSNPRQLLRLIVGLAYVGMGIFFITKQPFPDVSTTLHAVLGGLCFAYGSFRIYRGLNDVA